VVDISDAETDWGHYPAKLNFTVIRQKPEISTYLPIEFERQNWTDLGISKKFKINQNTYRFCSSIFDVTGNADRIKETNIVFSDSDIFYLKPIFPSDSDFSKFNCRRGLVGFYYYDKTSAPVRRFLELWRNCMILSLQDHEFRHNVTKHYRIPNFINQEAVFVYLSNTADLSRAVRFLSSGEHCTESEYPHEDLKFFHFTGGAFGDHRGLATLVIKEYYEMIQKVLGDKNIRLIFGPSGNIVPRGTVLFQDRHSLIKPRLTAMSKGTA
jgi:hypothetical protein